MDGITRPGRLIPPSLILTPKGNRKLNSKIRAQHKKKEQAAYVVKSAPFTSVLADSVCIMLAQTIDDAESQMVYDIDQIVSLHPGKRLTDSRDY